MPSNALAVGLAVCLSVLVVVSVRPGPEVLVPEAVDDAEDGEGGCDDDEQLVLPRASLLGHVLVLAASKHGLVYAV